MYIKDDVIPANYTLPSRCKTKKCYKKFYLKATFTDELSGVIVIPANFFSHLPKIATAENFRLAAFVVNPSHVFPSTTYQIKMHKWM